MSTDGALRFDTAGSPADPLIVLVHGAMDRSAGMLRLSRRLDDSFHVLRYDRRGYGRSIGVGPPFTIADHVRDLESLVVEHAPAGSAALVFGHSLGGNVALGLADRRPDLVHAVAMYETPLSWLEWWPHNSAGATALSTPDPADAAEAFMRRIVGDAIWERLPGSTRTARRAEGPAMVGELADLRSTAPWDATRIGVPVLVSRGENARPHHLQGAAALIEMFADVRFHELAGAGHDAPNSHAAELAGVLASFVNSLGD
jgi:pimeloyl-ACP methyl ester carboxylesterase